jgi:hypothetical protein
MCKERGGTEHSLNDVRILLDIIFTLLLHGILDQIHQEQDGLKKSRKG